MEDSFEDSLHLDQLPFVFLRHLSSFLSPEDLARFSSVNKTCYDACDSEELWRNHSFDRWQFCDIKQISEGPERWRRYFRARRRVEKRMDTGRPMKDYRVKSLRGHKTDIVNAICLNGSNNDLENPRPPLAVSLSIDHTIYAWDVTEGKPVWSLEDKPVSCIAAGINDNIAIGDNNGHVTIYSVLDWSETDTIAPPTPDRVVTSIDFVTIVVNKTTNNCLLISYCLDDDSGEILVKDITRNIIMAILTVNTACPVLSIKGVWLAAAQEQSASQVFVWNLSDVLLEDASKTTPNSSSSSPPTYSPHITLHPNSSCSRPLIWLKSGTLVTCSTGQPSLFLPYPMPGPIPVPPGQVHIQPVHQQRRILHHRPPPQPFPYNTTGQSSDIEIWNIAKHIEESKKSSSLVFNIKHMYDGKVIKMSCFPQTVAYSNGVLVVGEPSGCVKVIDISNGQCLQTFNDHKASITDIYADSYRVLTCSKDFSIRVYSWCKETGPPLLYKLQSRYQLLGGSVALKTHDGFNRILCQSGSCVGVAGNILKLYNFIHQLE